MAAASSPQSTHQSESPLPQSRRRHRARRDGADDQDLLAAARRRDQLVQELHITQDRVLQEDGARGADVHGVSGRQDCGRGLSKLRRTV